MPTLEKAVLAELENESNPQSRANPRIVPGSEELVQFNPASLRLGRRNVHDPNENQGRQVRQYNGRSSDTYTLELHFDSADDDRGGQPVSVRERTAIVERYLQPGTRNATPPRIRFSWGDLIIDGVVESIDLDFDFFAANGVPLRAKVTLTIKGQDSTCEVLPDSTREAGSSTNRPNDAGSGMPGFSFSGGLSVGLALGGESPAEFSARFGLDASAWRGLDFDLDASIEVGAGMSLAAGASVSFGANMGANVGIGAHVGFSVGVDASLAASFGLEADASVRAGATAGFSAGGSASVAAGFRLSAAGGVEAAIEQQKGHEAAAAALHAAAAFGGPSGASGFAAAGSGGRSSAAMAPSGPTQPRQDRTPLLQAGARAGAHVDRERAPEPPRADPRATSYGFGLPLRARVTVAGDMAGDMPGAMPEDRASVRPSQRERAAVPSVATRRTEPPWTALPSHDRGRQAADAIQEQRRPQGGCGPCHCDPEAPWSIERGKS